MLFISILTNLDFKVVLCIHSLSLHSCFQLSKTHGGQSLVAQLLKNLSSNEGDAEMGVRKMPWRRKWQPTPVFLPGKFRGQRSLVGYSPWGRKESNMSEYMHTHKTHGNEGQV